MNTAYSKWYVIKVCSHCKAALSSLEEYHSSGVCPYCAHESGSTICDTKNLKARDVYNRKPILFGLFHFKKYVRTEYL